MRGYERYGMRRYRIERTADFQVDGALEKAAWAHAAAAIIDQYPWRKPADPAPPRVEARLLYSATTLYGQFRVQERQVLARQVTFQAPVCTDSCVEFFVAPTADGYLNVEINAIGTLLLQRNRTVREGTPVSAEAVRGVRIATSLPKGVAIPQPAPGPAAGYVVEYAVPLALFTELTGCPAPAAGTVWRANFYKCCDSGPEPAWGSWSPVGTRKPDFHCPEYFGEVVFV